MTRSASRRVLTNTSVDLCAVTSAAIRSYTSPQSSLDATGPSSLPGDSIARSSSRRGAIAMTTGSGRPLPLRKCATVSIGFCVAESPMRMSDRSVNASRRSSDNVRWAPRLSSATAWISSTITVDTMLQHRAAAFGCQEDIERLRCGHQDMGRTTEHRLTCRHQRVARADSRADVRHLVTVAPREADNLRERAVEVLLDVVAERLQGRHVHDLGAIGEPAIDGCTNEPVDAGEKRRQGLAGPRGRRDQRAASCDDVRPASLLRFGRRTEPSDEPLADDRMSPLEARGLGDARARH